MTNPISKVEEKLIEKLAAIEHERWADWQRYCHDKIDSVGGHIPVNLKENWERQIATPYDQLSEEEKQSDRDQVMRYWPIIIEFLSSYRQELIEWAEREKKYVKDEGPLLTADGNMQKLFIKEHFTGFNSALDQLIDKLKKVRIHGECARSSGRIVGGDYE